MELRYGDGRLFLEMDRALQRGCLNREAPTFTARGMARPLRAWAALRAARVNSTREGSAVSWEFCRMSLPTLDPDLGRGGCRKQINHLGARHTLFPTLPPHTNAIR